MKKTKILFTFLFLGLIFSFFAGILNCKEFNPVKEYIFSNHYLPFEMYRLIALDLQKTINKFLFFTGIWTICIFFSLLLSIFLMNKLGKPFIQKTLRVEIRNKNRLIRLIFATILGIFFLLYDGWLVNWFITVNWSIKSLKILVVLVFVNMLLLPITVLVWFLLIYGRWEKLWRMILKVIAISHTSFNVILASLVVSLVLLFNVSIYLFDVQSPVIYERDFGLKRYIRLREWNPSMNRDFIPEKRQIDEWDNLVAKKYTLRIDDQGFIMPSRIHDDPDVNIVFLGGSTTENLWMEEKLRFPYLVGRILEEKTGKKVNSFNGGVSGNNSLHSIDILLNKIIPLKPDIVVLGHNWNDLAILLLEGSYWNDNPTRSPIVENIPMKKSKDEFGHLENRKIEIDKQKLTKAFEENLQTFIAICNIRGIIPVLMTQESRITENPDENIRGVITRREIVTNSEINFESLKELFDLFNEVIRETGKKNNVLVIDLAEEVPQKKEYIYDVIHLNEKGSKLSAEVISRELVRKLEKE